MTVIKGIVLMCLTLLVSVFIACSEGGADAVSSTEPEIKSYSGCQGLDDLIPKLALPGTVTIQYHQVVQLGREDTCNSLIEKLNKPENLK